MEINHHKTTSVRELCPIDITPLLFKLPLLMKEWDNTNDFEINQNKKYSLNQVNHVNFRWSNKKENPVQYFDLPLWKEFKDVLLPILKKAVEPLGYTTGYFPRVMLAKMEPGTVIPEHIDGRSKGWIAHKIHVPLITNPQAIFFVAGKAYQFEKGKAYEVNNGAMHGVKNEGATARIHLIFEYLDGAINEVPRNDLKD